MGRTGGMIAVLMMASAPSADAGETPRRIEGIVVDPRVFACGVELETGRILSVQPYLEAEPTLRGQMSLRVAKISPSGRSLTGQTSAFSGGRLEKSRIGVDGAARVDIGLRFTDENDKDLCTLEVTINADGQA